MKNPRLPWGSGSATYHGFGRGCGSFVESGSANDLNEGRGEGFAEGYGDCDGTGCGFSDDVAATGFHNCTGQGCGYSSGSGNANSTGYFNA